MNTFQKWYSIVRSQITYLIWAVICLLFVLPVYLLSLLPVRLRYDNRLFYTLTSWWCRLLFWTGGIRVRVHGRQNLPKDPSVLVMNHAAALDIFIIEQILGAYPRIWMSKMSYKAIPLFSTILQRMHVLVDITNARAAARSLAKMVGLARNKKRHVLIFPEGGRFTDGQIHPFFGGFTILASKLKRQVVPIYIGNAHLILDPTGYLINNFPPLEIIVGKPFVRLEDEADAAFNDRVRTWFVQQAKKR